MLEHLLCMIWPKECPLHNPTSYAIFILHFYLSMFDTRGINLHLIKKMLVRISFHKGIITYDHTSVFLGI